MRKRLLPIMALAGAVMPASATRYADIGRDPAANDVRQDSAGLYVRAPSAVCSVPLMSTRFRAQIDLFAAAPTPSARSG